MTTSPQFVCSEARPITLVRVAGKDAAKFLNNFCTNDIKSLGPGNGCEAFSCDAKGRILFHWNVAFLQDTYWISAAAEVGERLWNHLDRYHFREEFAMDDLSGSWSELIFAGEPSIDFTALADVCHASLKNMYSAAAVQLHEQSGYVQKLPILGTDVFHLFGPKSWIEQLAVLARTSAVPLTLKDIEQRRIAAGWPLAHIDYDEKTIPQELNRDSATISFNKGCYIGQETVARLDAMGQVQRKLVGFTFQHELPSTPFSVKQDEKEIATISSWCKDPHGDRHIGIGFARRSHFQPGTVLSNSDNPITVSALPFPNEAH